jgi:trimeric autotransporter adhesin
MNKSLGKAIFLTCILHSAFFIHHSNAQSWEDVGGGTEGGVHGLTIFNNNLIASGSFANPCARVAEWDSVNWSCFGSGVGIVGRDAIEYHGDLVVCGDFWNVWQPCTDCNGIARWDGTQWLPMGTGFNNDVLTMMIWNDTLYAAGDFTTADGNPATRIARWGGSGWLPVGNNPTAFDNEIRTMAVYNGELWVGGDFFNADGCIDCNGIARYNGTNWVSVGIPGGVDSTVRALYVDTIQNKIYMGGHFIEVAGDTNAKGIAVYDGISWSPLSQGVYGKGQYVRGITMYNGDIVIGGYFSHVDFTINAKRVARWNTTTHTWSNIGDGFTGGYVRTFEVWNGDLYAGGSFDTSGTVPRPYIARWRDPVPTEVNSIQNDGSTVRVYPNPFSHELTVRSSEIANLMLCDVTGKEIMSCESIYGDFVINTETLAAGLYFLRVDGASGVRNYKVTRQ